MLPCSMKSYDRSYDLSGLNTSKNRAFLSFVEKIVNEKLNSKESQSLSMDNKEEIIRQLLNIVKINDIDDDILSMQLKFLLILSRSRDNIELLSRSSILEMLQENAGLDLTTRDSSLIKSQSILASLKTIANLIFQSGIVQKFYEVSGLAERALTRIHGHSIGAARQDLNEIRFFEARVLFLLTSLCPEVRIRIRFRMNAVSMLNSVLLGSFRQLSYSATNFEEECNQFRCEVLKILFNITINVRSTCDQCDEKDSSDLLNLTSTLNRMICTSEEREEDSDDLTKHIINLLVNVPCQCYSVLRDNWPAYKSANKECPQHPVLVYKLVSYMKKNILKHESDETKLSESCGPVLQVLIMFATKDSYLRKLLKQLILPKLTEEDLRRDPREGQTLRNLLIRMMTNTDSKIQTLSAALLFAICHHNVSKFVKYTGFGNAAGLLANLGLLLMVDTHGTKHQSKRQGSNSDSASESENDAYDSLNVNPITGKAHDNQEVCEDTRTEEQKEHDAMELVNVLDKMQRTCVIRPAKIGPDGRLIPVEHILELQNSDNSGVLKND